MEYEIGKGKPPINGQFKKGQSGNPEGARKHNDLKTLLKKVDNEEAKKVINECLTSTVHDLRLSIYQPNVTVLKAVIANILIKAIDEGDPRIMNFLLKTGSL